MKGYHMYPADALAAVDPLAAFHCVAQPLDRVP